MKNHLKFIAAIALAAAAAIMLLLAPAGADVFYSSSNYSTGSAGVIKKTGSGYQVFPNLVVNLGRDAAGFSFADSNGALRAVIREYQYGANDPVYVYSPSNMANWTPVKNGNRNDWGSNIHAVASGGRYLYTATYESYGGGSSAQNTGEVRRVDMKNGYASDKSYHYALFTGEAGYNSSPHGEGVTLWGGKVYAMFGVSFLGVSQYEPTEIVEFDAELNRLRSVKLKDTSGHTGKNAARMARRGKYLYVACMGGYQGPGSWGDIWQVDLDTMTALQALDGHAIPYTVNGQNVAVGMYGIDFAPDGAAYILTGSYSESYSRFYARLFVTTENDLINGLVSNGNIVDSITTGGYSWDVLYDDAASTLWLLAGTSLQARSEAGNLVRTFTPAELGDNVYSISLFNEAVSLAEATAPAALPAPPDVDFVEPGTVADAAFLANNGMDMDDLDEVKSETDETLGFALKKEKALALARAIPEWSGEAFNSAVPVPVLSADVTSAGNTAAAGYKYTGRQLMAAGKDPSRIRIVKYLGPGQPAARFAYGVDENGNISYGDGTYYVEKGGALFTGLMDDDEEYTLVVVIKDGGAFDLDGGQNGKILDPGSVTGYTEEEYESPPGGGSWGGGCNAGAGGAALLMAIARVAAARGRKLWK